MAGAEAGGLDPGAAALSSLADLDLHPTATRLNINKATEHFDRMKRPPVGWKSASKGNCPFAHDFTLTAKDSQRRSDSAGPAEGILLIERPRRGVRLF